MKSKTLHLQRTAIEPVYSGPCCGPLPGMFWHDRRWIEHKTLANSVDHCDSELASKSMVFKEMRKANNRTPKARIMAYEGLSCQSQLMQGTKRLQEWMDNLWHAILLLHPFVVQVCSYPEMFHHGHVCLQGVDHNHKRLNGHILHHILDVEQSVPLGHLTAKAEKPSPECGSDAFAISLWEDGQRRYNGKALVAAVLR